MVSFSKPHSSRQRTCRLAFRQNPPERLFLCLSLWALLQVLLAMCRMSWRERLQPTYAFLFLFVNGDNDKYTVVWARCAAPHTNLFPSVALGVCVCVCVCVSVCVRMCNCMCLFTCMCMCLRPCRRCVRVYACVCFCLRCVCLHELLYLLCSWRCVCVCLRAWVDARGMSALYLSESVCVLVCPSLYLTEWPSVRVRICPYVCVCSFLFVSINVCLFPCLLVLVCVYLRVSAL